MEDKYNEIFYTFSERKGGKRKIGLRVRMVNEGVAFRYIFLEQQGESNFTLATEASNFNLVGNPKVLLLFRENYLTKTIRPGKLRSAFLFWKKETGRPKFIQMLRMWHNIPTI